MYMASRIHYAKPKILAYRIISPASVILTFPVITAIMGFSSPFGGPYAGLEARALEEVRARGLLENTLFSCFEPAVLYTLRELEPAARLGLLLMKTQGFESTARELAVEAIHPHLNLATEELTRHAHSQGWKVNVFTVNKPADQKRLMQQGVDGLFTNLPAQLHRLVAGPVSGA